MRIKHIVPACIVALLVLIGCYKEEKLSVAADFTLTVEDDDYSVPSRILLENKSTGADSYQWTFEGGEPAGSTGKQPGAVAYNKAGTYTIRLEAWNDDEHKVKEFVLQLDSAVTVGFDVTIPINDISPVQAVITNTTVGGSTFQWTFENGTPATSEQQHPEPVTFTTEGEHRITLQVSNGREHFTYSKTVAVKPAMSLDFDITPFFKDEDMEAPLTATLTNKSINGLSYKWSADGGAIADDTAEDATTIDFDTHGTYTITLEADNGKEVKQIAKSITVKPNSGLYTMTDVKLGIKSAHATVGSFYACSLRATISKDELTAENGALVDIIFFGLDQSFSYCKFVSPDLAASSFAFETIPDAKHTAVVNLLESSPITFTATDFDSMVTDAPLQSLPIWANDDSGNTDFFTKDVLPRIVLFETEDGRKGAIKVRGFVNDGLQSYILADIKVQKKSNE
ncbi:MAG: PKD domain-containing protein [Prevotellaceae bacterium]|jgi:PKD repeat protein|nr:PKD domain-containing protein [Prevotellaceae bacterium]